jgi:hypothetical protein
MNVRIEFRPVGSTSDTSEFPQTLAVHAQNALGLPACGQPIQNWTDGAGMRWNAKPVATSDPVTCEKEGCRQWLGT